MHFNSLLHNITNYDVILIYFPTDMCCKAVLPTLLIADGSAVMDLMGRRQIRMGVH